MLYIVTGGSGSGKSEYAEQIAVKCRRQADGPLYYLATMRVWDDEGRKRVERHRQMRMKKGFETIERDTDLAGIELCGYLDENDGPSRQKVSSKAVILLECMSNLVLNEFYDQEEGARERILCGIKHLQKQCRDLIIVTNEIFSDGVTYDPESERYIRLLGQLNQELGKRADSVTEVVYGIPLAIHVSGKRKVAGN